MELESSYLLSITATTTKRKELEVAHDLSLSSSLPKKIKLEHANFPQFLEEGEQPPVAALFDPTHEHHHFGIQVMEEDQLVLVQEKEDTACSLMDPEVESKTKFNHHDYDCMLPQAPQQTKSAYLWSGFF